MSLDRYMTMRYLERVNVIEAELVAARPITVGTAAADQIIAATEESEELAAQTAAMLMDVDPNTRYTEKEDGDSWRRSAMVMAIMERPGLTHCLHAGSIQPLLVDLVAQAVVCRSCARRRWPRRMVDTHCDWCLEPSTDGEFGGVSITMRYLTVAGDACSRCYGEVVEVFGL